MIEVVLLPERGLDVAAIAFRGIPLGWRRGDEPGTIGVVSTCGLDNVGAPSEGFPKHGTYSFLPARELERGDGLARATLDDPRGLRVRRTIRWDERTLRLEDATANVGVERLEAPLLYHCNFAWDGVEIDSDEVLPRDDDARAADWRERGSGPERVYEHFGATRAVVAAGPLRVEIRSSLPRLWQWIQPEWGALGIEPANCSVLGRAHDRAGGRLPFLEPGEERVTTLELTLEER